MQPKRYGLKSKCPGSAPDFKSYLLQRQSYFCNFVYLRIILHVIKSIYSRLPYQAYIEAGHQKLLYLPLKTTA